MTDETRNPANPQRRKFLRNAGLIPAGIWVDAASIAKTRNEDAGTVGTSGSTTMMNYVAPVLDTIRVGVIGAGRRGTTILRLLAGIDGIDVKAIGDSHAPAIDRAQGLMTELGVVAPAFYSGSDYAYRELLERDDIDAVFVLTPWSWHTPMAVEVMQSGKHAFVEVPAALTLDEGWQLVETSVQTRMNCMMMENVCYGREELMALNMIRQGVLGELLHGEAAYIHELRWQMKDIEEGTGSWRTAWHARRNANLYPTHGLGPIAQYMNLSLIHI